MIYMRSVRTGKYLSKLERDDDGKVMSLDFKHQYPGDSIELGDDTSSYIAARDIQLQLRRYDVKTILEIW